METYAPEDFIGDNFIVIVSGSHCIFNYKNKKHAAFKKPELALADGENTHICRFQILVM